MTKIISTILDRIIGRRINLWAAGYQAARTDHNTQINIRAPHPPAGPLPLLGDLGDTEQDVELTIVGDGSVLTIGKIIAVDKAGWIKLRHPTGTVWINSAHIVRIEVSR